MKKSKWTSSPTILFGSPRSGTSWLGKILDSHPTTHYLMEPDTIVRATYPSASDDVYLKEAREHIEKLLAVRKLKVTGSRPVFHKSYEWPFGRELHEGLVYAFKSMEKVLPQFGGVSIPVFGSLEGAVSVIKSVSMMERASSWAASVPEAKFIHLIRHPCGHAYSVLRGQSKGSLESGIPLGFEACAVAKKYDITTSRLQSMSERQRIIWRWAILNEHALNHIPNSYKLVYEDLCESPVSETKKLFEHLDLEWNPQTEGFIQDSVSSNGSYFEPKRIPSVAANKWRSELVESEALVDEIKDTKIYRDYFLY